MRSPPYEEAKAALRHIAKELKLINESAVSSLNKRFEETLTLHRLGLFSQLGISFKTTNCIESLNSQIARLTRRVSRWSNSHQKHRWMATVLLDIEPRLRKIKGLSVSASTQDGHSKRTGPDSRYQKGGGSCLITQWAISNFN